MNIRGSEWNKGDLHVHTQSSTNCYKNKAILDEQIVQAMVDNNIAVFAVTDHHTIDIERYNRLRELAKAQGITVLPGIEFLSDARGREPIHFIGIFSEKADLSYIWGQLENRTEIHRIRGEGKKSNQVYCNLKDTINLIRHELNGIVSIHAGEKSNSVENITNALPQAMAQKVDIASNIDIYELGNENEQQGYIDNVFPHINRHIPMIICSDNHNAAEYHIKQNLWIKGATNFDGLRYALNEPQDRFYIGEQPPAVTRVRENPTKYLSQLTIKRTGSHNPEHIWFDKIDVPLNKELVTIIGNKGSGKSALSDIIAFCADSEHSLDYTFLNKSKFKKKGFAERFCAQLEFESGNKTEEKQLNLEIDPTSAPRVRYLPQSYFEKVCNEIGKIEAFRTEIEKVVFQYIPDHERLEKKTFKDLIQFKKQSIETEIKSLSDTINSLNVEIIKLEDSLSPDNKRKVISNIKLKKEELKVHHETKPETINSPDKSKDDTEALQKKKDHEIWSTRKESVEKQIHEEKEEINACSINIEGLENFKRDVQVKISELGEIKERNEKLALINDLDFDSILKTEFDQHPIDKKLASLTKKKRQLLSDINLDSLLATQNYDEMNLALQLNHCISKIAAIESSLSKDQKQYQDYVKGLKRWEKQLSKILGSNETVDSLRYSEKQLSEIENSFPEQLEIFRAKRLDSSIELFNKKHEIKSIYDNVKANIDEQLNTTNVTDLSIASSFSPDSEFEETLLGNILQNKIGSFYGSEDGRKLLREKLILNTDWNDETNIRDFLTNFISYLEYDKRTNGGKPDKIYIGSIVKNRLKFYNYLFTLEYLLEHYDLQQNGKSLEELSPGEKGALLLVFYLVLDKEDIPLVIDQPEDNLDNNSVAKVLVPFIKEAKKRRQIIMVTHNPNLAVVADSEQVIRVQIEKDKGNIFSFSSGGIEIPKINSDIVDVLEGTIPAFTMRRLKYHGVA